MNRQENYFLFLQNFCFFWMVSLFIFSCNKPPTTNTSFPKRNTQEVINITSRLPYQNPVACAKIIKDSARSESEILEMCSNVMSSARLIPPNTYFQLLQSLDSTFGQSNQDVHVTALLHKGQALINIGQVDSALNLAKESLLLSEKMGDSMLISMSEQTLSNCYMRKSNFAQALSAIYKAIDYSPKNQRKNLSNLLMDLAQNYTMIRNYPKATEYAFKSLKIMEEEKDSAIILSYAAYLSSAYSDLQQGDSALWAAKKAYSMAEAIGDSSQLGFIYWTMANAYLLKKDYTNALDYAQQALKISEEQQNISLISLINTTIANCYLAMGESQKAKVLYLSTLEEQTVKMKVKANTKICDSLVVINLKESGNLPLLNYYRKVRTFMDSLFSVERIHAIEDMNVRYQTAEKEQKISELAIEKKVFQIQALITTLVLLLVLFVGAWIIYRNRQRQILLVKENELLESNKKLLESSHEVLAISKQLQAQELASHKQQLQDFSENILTKNQMIQEMEKKISQLLENTNEIATEQLKRNKDQLNNMKILTEKDWKTYLGHFEKVYPGFIKQINERFSDLTSGELRLSILINVGFLREEVADILGISRDSVRKNEYRLRKKLGLGEEDNLREFIQKCNSEYR